MIEHVVLRKGAYHDSARLMAVARELRALPGMTEAVVLMGTPMNLDLISGAGFGGPCVRDATPLDVVIALRGEREEEMAVAESRVDELLGGRAGGGPAARGPCRDAREGLGAAGDDGARDLGEALAARPDANVVSIAVPGPYAAYVAHRALDAGKHVFLFSNNVSTHEEIALKKRASGLGLFLMGPDCGTAILAGTGFGFANRVRRGPVGIVGASGTGIQELCCLLDRAGAGISHAIGTGGRDLSAPVGGTMTEMAIEALAADPGTRVVILTAKHPDAGVAERVHGILARLGKPCVVRYLGEPGGPARDGVVYAGSLDEAAEAAAERAGGASRAGSPSSAGLAEEAARGAPEVRGRLVGLFGGGSLAAEAKHILETRGIACVVPDRALLPGEPFPGSGHLVVDTGEDFYTVGRPHPMVDQTIRCDLIRAVGADPSVGLLLLDLVLGDGAHPDPAPEIVAAIEEARGARSGARLEIVSSVTGAAEDPQDRDRQEALLREAGVRVAPSAARAALLAAALLTREREASR